MIIIRTELVIDSKIISQLDESLAARIVNWRCWSRRRIINAVDAAVRVADPDAARERRLAAEERDRHISVTALPDGLARVSGTVATTAGPGRHELPTRASKTAPNGPSTKSTGASGEPENTKSKRASSEITCGACYFSSKGKPSTSPFCRWVNDPIEPEELPPDWQPPPKPPPLPDEPSF